MDKKKKNETGGKGRDGKPAPATRQKATLGQTKPKELKNEKSVPGSQQPQPQVAAAAVPGQNEEEGLAHVEGEEGEAGQAETQPQNDNTGLTPTQIIERDVQRLNQLNFEGEDEEMAEGEGDGEEGEDYEQPEEFKIGDDEEEEIEQGEEKEEEVLKERREPEEEEYEAEEEEEEEEATEKAPTVDPNDPDNIISMMMQNEEVDDEELKLLFMDTGAIEQETETIANYPGLVGIDLSDDTLAFFELENLLNSEPPFTYISFKRVKLHIYIYGESSEFFPLEERFKNYPDYTMLIGVDFTKSTGHSYYLCTTVEARNLVLNPPKKKRKVVVDLKQKEEEAWAKMASVQPRKWHSLGSELEIDAETVHKNRPLLTLHAYRDLEKFNRPITFADWNTQDNPNALVQFEPKDPTLNPTIESMEVDAGVQVNRQKVTSSSQTGFSFKRNKIIQYENQFLDPETVQALLDLPGEVIAKRTKVLQRALIQNEMMNLAQDDFKKLKAVKGHDVEYNNESVLLQEYQTYTDMKHSKNRCVTQLVFHPTLEDVVVVSICEDATFDTRIDLHSKTLMEPNFVLFWDLKDPIRPQLMLDAPSDVFSFHVNPSDPQIMCGGCANGQVVLWDLGRLYTELKAHIQDRRRKSKESDKKEPTFLEKLKDQAEKFVCPLVPCGALSNLDQSHKKVVTSVCWLPPHVELGRNGTLYENSLGGKSVQFFSTAADGSILLWDIRPPKAGLEEYDVDTSKDIIKVNPWAHLQNNMWKFTSKYILDDGSGTMYASIMSLSEPRQGDTTTIDLLNRVSRAQSSGDISESPHDSKDTLDKPSGGELRSKSGAGGERSGVNVHGGRSSNVGGSRVDLETSEMDMDAGSSKRGATPGVLTVLPNALTSIFIGTETGQIALVDWLRNKDGSMNSQVTGARVCQNMYCEVAHDGAITCVARSPFYNNLILVIGGGTISIWKENSGHPLLATGGSEYFPWCGCFSNTRPAVFFVGTREGALQVWDLTEKSQGPVLVQQISPGRITTCAMPKAGLAKKQFLALGDSLGNVFAMVLPRFYYKPTSQEASMIQELMAREEKRLINWNNDAVAREEKIEAVHTAWKEARKATGEEEQAQLELQLEDRLSAEYAEFLEFESKLVERLKLTEPTVESEETNAAEDFEYLVRNAREKEAELREIDEEEGEELESTSVISIGSDNDFY